MHKVPLPQKTMKPDSEFTYKPSDCRKYKGQKNMFKYTMRMLSVKSIKYETTGQIRQLVQQQ